jgi:hypothetical protein
MKCGPRQNTPVFIVAIHFGESTRRKLCVHVQEVAEASRHFHAREKKFQ